MNSTAKTRAQKRAEERYKKNKSNSQQGASSTPSVSLPTKRATNNTTQTTTRKNESTASNIIPGLSMVAQSTTAKPSAVVKSNSGRTSTISTTPKTGSVKKIEDAYAQRYSGGSFVPTGEKINAALDVIDAIPSLQMDEETQAARSQSIINRYDTTPSYNFFERLTDPQKKTAYEKKQSIAGEYETAKLDSTAQKIANSGLTLDDIKSALNEYGTDGFLTDAQIAENTAKHEESLKKLEAAGISGADAYDWYRANYARPELEQNIQERAESNPVLSTLGSFATNIIEGVTDFAGNAVNYLKGNPMEVREDETTQKVRQAVGNNINSDLGKVAYDLGTSVGDTATAALVGGILGGKAGAGGIQGMTKANQVLQEGVERGLTPNQIALESALSFGTTAVTEALSYGKISEIAEKGISELSAKAIGKALGAQMATEGLQEVAEEAADYLADFLVAQDQNKVKQSIQTYMDNGLSKEAAVKQTLADIGQTFAMDFAGGALGGLLLGGGMNLTNAVAGNYGQNTNVNVVPTLENVEQSTDNVVQNAQAEAQAARQAIEALAAQIPTTPETTTTAPETAQIAAEIAQAEIPTLEAQNAEIGQNTQAVQEQEQLAETLRQQAAELQTVPGTESVQAELLTQAEIAEQNAVQAQRANPENVVYHAGTFSKLNKAETNGRFSGSNRGTGYFGTGHYFVDGNTIGELQNGSYKEQPLTSVDISGYSNLFRANTDAKAQTLHNFLEHLTKATQGSDKYSVDELYQEYLDAFTGEGNIMSPEAFENRLAELTAYMRKSDMSDRGDSVSTQFMKSLGYGGVDTRGTRFADTRYGTVIYDVDENSILQSNVPADQTANTDMLSRSEDRTALYDTAEDERIQGILDGQQRTAEIREIYNGIYDATQKSAIDEEYETALGQRKALQDTVYELQSITEDSESYVAQSEKEFASLGFPPFTPEERAGEIERVRASFTEALNERTAELSELDARIAELEALDTELQRQSNEAWRQAEAIYNQQTAADTPIDAPSEIERNIKVPVVDDTDFMPFAENDDTESLYDQIESRAAELEKIIGSDGFRAMEFENQTGTYIVSRSTRDGVEYQLSYIDKEGVPTSHQEFATPAEVAAEVNDLTWNQTEDFRLIDESSAGYADMMDNIEASKKPIYNGKLTKEGFENIRNMPEPKNGYKTPKGYGNLWANITAVLTAHDLGQGTGCRECAWKAAEELNAYFKDHDPEHLTNAQAYANYVDEVLEPYHPGEFFEVTREITTKKGKKKKVTNRYEVGSQNLSGRVARVIDTILLDEKNAIFNQAPESLLKAVDDISKVQEKNFSINEATQDLVNVIRKKAIKLLEGETLSADDYTEVTNAGTNLVRMAQSLKGIVDKNGSELPEHLTEPYIVEKFLDVMAAFDEMRMEIEGTADVGTFPPEVAQDIAETLNTNEETETEAPAEAEPEPEIPTMQAEEPQEEYEPIASIASDVDDGTKELTIDPAEFRQRQQERARQEKNAQQGTGEQYQTETETEWDKRNRRAEYEDADHVKVTQTLMNTLGELLKDSPEGQKALMEAKETGYFRADVIHEAASTAEARQAIEAALKVDGNVDGVLNDILRDDMELADLSAPQQDTLMMALDKKVEEAQESGDFTEVMELFDKASRRVRKIAQSLQALAKYTRTASSAIVKADTMINGITDEFTKNPVNKSKANLNAKLAKALETMGNKDADKTTPKKPLTHEQIREQVQNTLDREFSSVNEYFDDSAVDQITALVESDIPVWQLRDELEHFLKQGEFYTIDESIETKQAKSLKLANALREATEGKQERVKVEKTLDEIQAEITALINTEYASIADEFTADDIYYLANRIKNGAETSELADMLNRKMATGYIGMSNEDLAQVVQLYEEVNSGLLSSREEYNAMQQANAILAKYLGKGTLMERMNQWRYMSMLISPSTHLKNIASNAAWSTTTMLKDTLAAGMEEIAARTGADFERTKGILLPTRADKALVQEAYKSFDRDVYSEYARGGSKYNDRNEIKQQQQLGNKYVNKVAEANSNALSAEDIFAGRMKYTQALAGYLKANGKDASIFNSTNAEDMALVKRAEDYALAEANKATFHEDNAAASVLTQFSRSTAEGGRLGLNMVVEGLIPFKKTTSNIAKQFTMEYNPLYQLPKAIYQTIRNDGNVAETIDSYAKGATGAGLVALGVYLASQGLLVATRDDDDKDDILDRAENYAITWFDKDGDQHYYTIDGLAPTAVLMSVGAQLYEGGFSLDSLAGIAESFIENSLLSGLNNMIDNLIYSSYDKEKDKTWTLATSIANTYASQFVPTVIPKIARAVDPTRRSTYTGLKGNADTTVRYGKQWLNKIPGLSMLNEPYIDNYGNEIENVGSNFAGRILYNLFSIGYYSERERDDIQNTIAELDEYAQGLDGEARDAMEKALTDLITAPDKSYAGEKVDPELYTELSKATGQTAVHVFDKLVHSDAFNGLEPEDQAALMDQMGLLAKNIAKRDVLGQTSSSYKKLIDLYDDRDMNGVLNYLTIKSAMNGETSNEAAIRALDNTDMTINQKSYYLSQFITNPSKDALTAINLLGDNGLYYWYSTCASGTKKEKYEAILNSGYSDTIQAQLATIVYNSGRKEQATADQIPSLETLISE